MTIIKRANTKKTLVKKSRILEICVYKYSIAIIQQLTTGYTQVVGV